MPLNPKIDIVNPIGELQTLRGSFFADFFAGRTPELYDPFAE